MISRVRGKAVAWHETAQSVEVDVAGLVYEIRLPSACWRALSDQRPEELSLFTHYHVPDRQPVPVLIGFQRPAERDFFRKLLSVPGMGVTKAQRALDASVSTIAQWIEDEDRRSLGKLPGIGARQAEKIIAELRGKVVEEALLVDEGYDGSAPAARRDLDRVIEDAVAALGGLGYPKRDADRWVAAAAADLPPDPPPTTESLLPRRPGAPGRQRLISA